MIIVSAKVQLFPENGYILTKKLHIFLESMAKKSTFAPKTTL